MPEQYVPEHEQQVRDMIRWAAAEGRTVNLMGLSTKRRFGHDVDAHCALSLRRFDGIRDYQPAELVMRAAAGTPLLSIEEALAEKGQRLAFEPPRLGELYDQAGDAAGSIGGVFMGNLAGPRRFVAGSARDHLLGVRAINGRGEVYKSGGAVIKNVTGYDISKLLSGSWGTLSVVTELVFKVLPAPAASATVALQPSTRTEALELVHRLAQSPYEVTGLTYFPERTAPAFGGEINLKGKLLLIRLEGTPSSIRERIASMRSASLLPDPHTLYEQEISERIWRSIRDVEVFVDSSRATALLKLSLPPTAALDVSRVIDQLGGCEWYADAAAGWIWVGICHGSSEDKINSLRREIAAVSGSAVLYRASEVVKRHVGVYSAPAPPLAALARRIKSSFDPDNLFNPGRLGIV
jgi:glycolate oxidase FAD binding subunit